MTNGVRSNDVYFAYSGPAPTATTTEVPCDERPIKYEVVKFIGAYGDEYTASRVIIEDAPNDTGTTVNQDSSTGEIDLFQRCGDSPACSLQNSESSPLIDVIDGFSWLVSSLQNFKTTISHWFA